MEFVGEENVTQRGINIDDEHDPREQTHEETKGKEGKKEKTETQKGIK